MKTINILLPNSNRMPTNPYIRAGYCITPAPQMDWANDAIHIMETTLSQSDEFFERLVQERSNTEQPWISFSLFHDQAAWNEVCHTEDHIVRFGNMTFLQYMQWLGRMNSAYCRLNRCRTPSQVSESSSSDEDYY